MFSTMRLIISLNLLNLGSQEVNADIKNCLKFIIDWRGEIAPFAKWIYELLRKKFDMIGTYAQ